MTLLAALMAGAVAGTVLLRLLGPTLAVGTLARRNHRGIDVPTAGGLVAVAATLLVLTAWAVVDGASRARTAAVLVVLGYGFLGLLDDVLGSGADGRGFGGHLRALRAGRLTTGGLKLLGGGGLGMAAVAAAGPDRPARLLLGGVVVALAANLANLFDRAPGRTIKVATLAVAVLVAAAGADRELAGVVVAAGACLALLPADLGERLMLGDTGANALGGVVGLGVVVVAPVAVQLATAGVLLALNLLSEQVSFSSVIDRVAPLRWIDRAGRPHRYPDLP